MRAVVADLDGEIIGIGALIYQRGAMVGLKMEIKPDMRRYKVALHKGAKMLLAIAKASGLPAVAAIRDATEPRSAQWMTRLGFQHATDDEEGEIWIWRG